MYSQFMKRGKNRSLPILKKNCRGLLTSALNIIKRWMRSGTGEQSRILRKVKHMQNILKREGLSNKTMKENIDTFEDVPAYVRKNLSLGAPESGAQSKLSKFTLTSDDNDEPVLRENNAYLNDNVD